MDFTNRSTRPGQPGSDPSGINNASAGVKNTRPGKFSRFRKHALLNITYLGLLLSITVVIVGVLLALFFFEGDREDKFVDSSKHQAIFLNNGQVYFGNITDLNNDFLTLSNIYYLRVNQQVQPGQQASQNDVSLVKLGCELHGPQDSMVVNRDQVTFWENLKDDGQVAKAIAEYVKANPNGQNCSQNQQQGAGENSTTPSSDNADKTTPSGSDNTNNNSNTPDNSNNNSTNNNSGSDNTNSNQ